MEELRRSGICIGTRQWKDNDRMLKIFCEDGCVYDALARGACKPKYKLKFAAQLFSACDYFLCPSRAGYYILGGATFGELSFLSLSADPDAYMAGCVVCEIAAKCTLAENKRLYAETVAALGELSVSGERGDLAVLRMLLAALSTCGYGQLPAGEKGALCRAALDAQAGNVTALSIEKAAVLPLLKTLGGQFAVHMEKLNSLSLYLESACTA